ncbi:extracellular matrix protein FRAS1 [Octodon degus]|uniref:Extracellular matrix protein FRAS1 n=1 Tax=Octodon degus TaxID=10160 RepID=A0A6P6DGE7_OCTDE|nr:extracellular matrix protein FRAS1 [Octodon degus]
MVTVEKPPQKGNLGSSSNGYLGQEDSSRGAASVNLQQELAWSFEEVSGGQVADVCDLLDEEVEVRVEDTLELVISVRNELSFSFPSHKQTFFINLFLGMDGLTLRFAVFVCDMEMKDFLHRMGEEPCSHEGRVYRDGEDWQLSRCAKCLCRDGVTQCFTAQCRPLFCNQDEAIVRVPGKCCPQCSPPPCSAAGHIYQHGEQWNQDSCTMCTCDRGKTSCHKQACPPLQCQKEGEKWEDGPCQVCECQGAQVTCYERACPPCPVATLALAVKGQCCPDCTSVPCHPDCLTCSRSPGHCDLCQDPTKLLENGQCVHSCSLAFYQAGSLCLACQPQCSACTNALECSSCRPPLLMQQGQCVAACGDGFYQDGHSCAACHASCAGCSGPTEKHCVVCRDPLQVLRHGSCENSCGDGFYDKQGTCMACDQSCKSCGPSSPRCLTCTESMLLHGGTCVSECPGGFYADASSRCKACHSSCASCTGPASSHCTSCVQPKVLHHGYCLTSCGEGFYADHGVCAACYASCQTCVGPEPSHCTECRSPEMGLQVGQLLATVPSGECLPHCSAQFYLESTGLCEACDTHCRSCTSPTSCTSCRDPNHVLLFGDCQSESCALQYYLDISTRTCRAADSSLKNRLWGLRLDGKQADLTQTSSAECDWSCNVCSGPLRTDCLQCMDGYVLQDGACEERCSLSFYHDAGLCKSCDNHCLQCQGPYQCTHCEEPFLLFEAQCVQECGKGYFADHAKHKCTGKTHTPSLHVNGSLTLAIGAMKPLDFSLLNVQPHDGTVEDLLFHVVSTPTNGQLVLSRNGKEAQLDKAGHFSWKDVNQRKVRFVHSKEKLRKGYFSLKISDQQFFSEPQLINIQAFSTQAPYVLRNEGLHISRGEQETITTQLLDIRDDDNPQDVVVEVLDSPRHGQLLHVLQSPAASISQFRLDELSRGLLYVHDGSNSTADVMVLQASDGHSFQNILFHVTIGPKNDGALQLMADSMVWVPEGGMLQITDRILQAAAPGASPDSIVYTITEGRPQFGEVVLLVSLPEDSPRDEGQHLPDGRTATPTNSFTQQDVNDGVVWYRHSGAPAQSDSFHFQAREDGLTVIQPHFLSFVNSKRLSGKIVYNITQPLHPNQGVIEHRDQPLSPIRYFTQEDINQGKIVYRPPLAAPHLQEIMAFSFAGLPESVKFHFTGLQVIVRDPQAVPEELFFKLQTPPQHGVLLKDTADFRGPMVAGDTFTYDDVEKNSVQYVHDGSSAREDSLEISVTEGLAVTVSQVRVEVSVSEDTGPRLAAGSSLSMTVSSHGTATITRSHLAYVDDSSPDAEIWIQLNSLPMYGALLRASGSEVEELSEVANFTMEDINNENIRYSAGFETVSHLVTDSFHFSVFDTDHNQLDNQIFTITITPAGNPPPVIGFADLITVDEGGRAPLSFHHFFATDDQDNLQEDAIIKLSVLPKYGCIENTGTGDRFGPGTTSSPEASFPIQDVLENYIYYFQSIHESIEPTHDIFSFYVSDGTSRSEIHSINITIERKNDEPPRMTLRPLGVKLSFAVVISNSSLSLQDLDTPDNELVFVLTKKPDHGHLLRRLTSSDPLENGTVLFQGSSFTYQDVLAGLVGYLPRDSGVAVDDFQFSLTDGLHVDTGRMEIYIELPKSDSPHMAINRGLQLSAGSVARITEQHLKVAGTDSDAHQVMYILKEDPGAGRLQMVTHDSLRQISVHGPIRGFTQADISQGRVEYSHGTGEPGGNFTFKFDVVDVEGNRLTGQSFSIGVLGVRISSFSQADVTSQNVQYVHSSETEKHSDAFDFVLSDGLHEVTQTFHITIHPVDDALPVVRNWGMRVQEGVRKTITEFELKAEDADTEADSVTFRVVQPPRHGMIERTSRGQHTRLATSFTMEDIYQKRISYSHDGSNSLKDRFTFTVSDGTNPFFIIEEGGKEITTAAPQQFRVDILPVDDGTPTIVTNLGLQWLEYMDGKATNLITKKELLTMDPDTDDAQLVYEITSGPKHGHVENKLQPGRAAASFTQEDVNLGLIRYVLHDEKIRETMDSFQFLVKDSKPNVVSDNVFHIQWSLISFKYTSYNISEKAGSVSVTVRRTGNLNQYAIVLCRTEQGTARSSSGLGVSAHPGQQDYVEYAGQVQFDEREDTKSCTIVINDDDVFENVESFTVELSMPAYALLGEFTQAKVIINDTEDEPTLEFDKKTYRVNESAGFLFAPIERKGDSSSIVSAVCYTIPKSAMGSSLYALESGSDFKSRGMSAESRVILGPGVTMSTCDVMIIDDSEYEEEEEFEIVLADASGNARIGQVAAARVLISGPNDASTVSLGNTAFTVSEDAGTVKIPVTRHGTDLSTFTSVWCATRPSDPASATPGVDYVPSSRKVEFGPGVTEQYCTLTILDDTQYPVIEGLETFVVFLSSAQGAELSRPSQAVIAINDTFQDVPSMQFAKDLLLVKEKEGILHVPIIRSGDLSYESSVRCYTQSHSARATEDFEERRNADSSRIMFLKGEKVKNCTVYVHDDSMFEPEEQFRIHLGHPRGNHWSGARVGKNSLATVTISNDEDGKNQQKALLVISNNDSSASNQTAPTIEFEEAAYQVREPAGPDAIAILSIKVIRRGDQNRTSKVRCSTRDGSAQSGVDYYPKSRVLKFNPGVDHIYFKVEILSNEDREWHESFSLVLGPDDPVEAVLGDVTTATVTILDQEAAGSLILPAPPIVVTLADYDHVEEATKEGAKKAPSPGYPLVCVTPCDPHFPRFAIMKEHCSEAGINQTSVQFSWEVAAPTDGNGARSPFETVTDSTPFTSVNHMVLDSIYFSRRFHVRCVAKAVDKVGHVGTPLRSNIVTIGTDSAICHTPVVAGTSRGFQAQSFIATLKYLDVKHKEHPNRIHISVQIPHQDGMLPLVSTMPLHNLHFLLSESIYRHQHVCSNLVTTRDLRGISEAGFLDDVVYDSTALGPGYDRPFQFDPRVRELKTIQLYKHLNLKSCVWTFDAYYDMTELIDVCGGSVTADFQKIDKTQPPCTLLEVVTNKLNAARYPTQYLALNSTSVMTRTNSSNRNPLRKKRSVGNVMRCLLQIISKASLCTKQVRDSAQSFLTVHVPLYVSYIYVTAPRGWASLEHHTEMEFSFFYDTVLWRTGIQTDSVLSARLQIIRIYIREDGRLVIEFKTHAKFRESSVQGSFTDRHRGENTSNLLAQTASAMSGTAAKDSSLTPQSCFCCQVSTQLALVGVSSKFLIPIAFQQTNRPVPMVYSLNTEFQLYNNEKVFLMDPNTSDMSLAEMDYKGAFSKGQILYGRVLWNPEQNLNSAYKLQLEKVYLCTGKDGYVPFFDPTGTIYNEGPQYGCIQPNKHLKHRFLLLVSSLLLDRSQPEVTDKYFHDVPFEAHFASELPDFHVVSSMPGVDGFTLKVDALYKVEAGHQWYLQVIYIIGPDTIPGPRVQRSLTSPLRRHPRDLIDPSGQLTLDDSLIYDNEGDQVKNGTNMKSLHLEMQEPIIAASLSQTGASVGSALAAVMLLLLVFLVVCFITRKCQKQKKKQPTVHILEEYPLNTKADVSKRTPDRVEKNVNRQYCTVRNVNILSDTDGAYMFKGAKVKKLNLEVRVHNNLQDGTEV